MKTMRTRVFALALCLLLLAGCGKQGTQFRTAVITTGGGTAEDAGTEEPAVPDSTEEHENLFEAMPESFQFSSGAGAWSTTLDIDETGAFEGAFLDFDMGDPDEGYPAGTRYVCEFRGQFTQPEPVDGTTWSMEIEAMELEHPADGAEEYADGVRYVYSGPYGLENAEELLIYLPDSPADSLPENFLNWIRGPYNWSPTEEGTLGIWGIYNVSQGYGFAGFE